MRDVSVTITQLWGMDDGEYVKDQRKWYHCYYCANELIKHIRAFSQDKDGKAPDWEQQYGYEARKARLESKGDPGKSTKHNIISVDQMIDSKIQQACSGDD